MIWVISLDFMKDIEVLILILNSMVSFEYGTEHGNIYGFLRVMSMVQEDVTVLVFLFGALVGSSKGSKYVKLDDGIDGEVKMEAIWDF